MKELTRRRFLGIGLSISSVLLAPSKTYSFLGSIMRPREAVWEPSGGSIFLAKTWYLFSEDGSILIAKKHDGEIFKAERNLTGLKVVAQTELADGTKLANHVDGPYALLEGDTLEIRFPDPPVTFY